MQLNHFSIVDKSPAQQLVELSELGFSFKADLAPKSQLKHFILSSPIDLTTLATSKTQTLLDFFSADTSLTWDIFYGIGLQLLGFVANFDFEFTDALSFARQIQLPLVDVTADISDSSVMVSAIYLLLNSRQKNGMTLVEHLV